jgi:hypothetical protein
VAEGPLTDGTMSNVTTAAKQIDSSIEEVKLLVGSSGSNFSVLVSWFTFFFVFQLTALAYVLGEPPELALTIVEISFVCFHLLGIAAVWAFHLYCQGVSRRLEV